MLQAMVSEKELRATPTGLVVLFVALDALVKTGTLYEVGDDIGILAAELVDTLDDKNLKVTFVVIFAALFIILAVAMVI